MKHATWIEPRSAIIVFRFLVSLANFQNKRHTLIRVRLHGLACAPRATPSLPGWLRSRGTRDPTALAAVSSKPPYRFGHAGCVTLPGGEAGRLFCTTGISFHSLSFPLAADHPIEGTTLLKMRRAL